MTNFLTQVAYVIWMKNLSLDEEAVMSFLIEFGLVNHQINSYNDFIKNNFQKIVDYIGGV